MSRSAGLVLAAALFLLVAAGIWAALRQGQGLEAGRTGVSPAAAHAAEGRPGWAADPLARLLLQLIVIVAFARIVGGLFRRFGQPAVIGEIVAGLLLGPSVFGALAPAVSRYLFEPSSLSSLKLFAEIGVLLFLFVVGLELDLGHLKSLAHAAVVVSNAGIIVPFFLGIVLSLALYPELAPAGVAFLPFALFLAIAMSITAFPVLARILTERGLTGTPLGTLALTCAAVDDVTAWSLLAVVVAVVGANGAAAALPTIGWTLAFLAVMAGLIKPWLGRLLSRPRLPSDRTAMAGAMVLLLTSALATEVIGIHALFGAFVAGAIFPRQGELREKLIARLEEVTTVLLLPIFFAFTGLRTEIGLLHDGHAWLLCALIIAVATAGKLGGVLLAARATRLSWPDSFALGALMNTRGLMELIALNLGYELGILSPLVFAMMVLMALVTTFSAGPLLALVERRRT